MGKESFSSLKKIHVTHLGKQDLEFGEGNVLKLTDNLKTIFAEASKNSLN